MMHNEMVRVDFVTVTTVTYVPGCKLYRPGVVERNTIEHVVAVAIAVMQYDVFDAFDRDDTLDHHRHHHHQW